jgi:hypothetical protein
MSPRGIEALEIRIAVAGCQATSPPIASGTYAELLQLYIGLVRVTPMQSRARQIYLASLARSAAAGHSGASHSRH